jgi:hypothetical protein
MKDCTMKRLLQLVDGFVTIEDGKDILSDKNKADALKAEKDKADTLKAEKDKAYNRLLHKSEKDKADVQAHYKDKANTLICEIAHSIAILSTRSVPMEARQLITDLVGLHPETSWARVLDASKCLPSSVLEILKIVLHTIGQETGKALIDDGPPPLVEVRRPGRS